MISNRNWRSCALALYLFIYKYSYSVGMYIVYNIIYTYILYIVSKCPLTVPDGVVFMWSRDRVMQKAFAVGRLKATTRETAGKVADEGGRRDFVGFWRRLSAALISHVRRHHRVDPRKP